MSNCLDLRNESVTFTEEEMDLPALRQILTESKPADKDQFEDAVKYLTAWFLTERNVEIGAGRVRISFGWGDSGHTFRDFRQTINMVLKPLMKKSKVHVFHARDAENPQEGWFKWPVDFKEGTK